MAQQFTFLSARVPLSIKERIEKLAKEEQRSSSQIIRRLLATALKVKA